MKLVTSIMGTVVVRVPHDEVGPRRGVLQRDVAQFIGDLYRFNVKPQIPEGVPAEAVPILQFQSGEFSAPDGKIPIRQAIVMPDGHAIIATDTSLADAVMTDYLSQLDRELGYRFGEVKPQRRYGSAVVVDFDHAFAEKIAIFRTIQEIIEGAVGRDEGRYTIKRVAFGTDAATDLPQLTSLEQLLPQDFVIERRVGVPLERTRFFSRALLTTARHLRVLEEIERAASM